MSKGAGRVSGLGDSDGLCVAAHSRATSARENGPGCRPPSPLSSATHSRYLAIATPFILCIVGRGLDRLTAHNERRQPAKLARSCGCLPCRGKHCSLPDFAPLNRGPTLTTPHLRGASGTPPPTAANRKASHCRQPQRRPGGRPPYIPLYHIPWGGPSPATHPRHPVGAGHARPAALPLPPVYLLHRRERS